MTRVDDRLASIAATLALTGIEHADAITVVVLVDDDEDGFDSYIVTSHDYVGIDVTASIEQEAATALAEHAGFFDRDDEEN